MLGNKKFANLSLAVRQTSMATGEATEAIKNLNDRYIQEPFIISNPYEGLDGIYNKQWVCKGKHQYREVKANGNSEWICQCGKQLTSKSK